MLKPGKIPQEPEFFQGDWRFLTNHWYFDSWESPNAVYGLEIETPLKFMLLTLYSNYWTKFMLFLNDNTILLSKIWLLRVL